VTILLHAVVAALYAIAAWARWPRDGDIPLAAARTATWLVPLALVLHAVAIARSIFTPSGLDLSFTNALSLVTGLAALFAWASGLLSTLPRVAAVVLPMAAIGVLLPSFWSDPHRFAYAGERWATAHIAVALIAYALFVVAALQALVLTGVEKRLHRGQSPAKGDTPPLLTLERYLFRLIGLGFVLLTLALGSGILFSEDLFGKPATFTHKNVFSVAGWLVFAVLLFGRWRYGWRGRTALNWILGGTVLLLLGYLGSKFVLEVLLHR
jgi:ABC-type uncharacterized transport system permease subunit